MVPAFNQGVGCSLPFGGGIEFGERHAEAVVREIREELNAEICNARYLDCMEYLYQANGRSYHEIIFIYEADFVDASLYAEERPTAFEADGTPLKAMWKPLSSFDETAPLAPIGLLDLLQTLAASR